MFNGACMRLQHEYIADESVPGTHRVRQRYSEKPPTTTQTRARGTITHVHAQSGRSIAVWRPTHTVYEFGLAINLRTTSRGLLE